MKPKVIIYNRCPEQVKSYIAQKCEVIYFHNWMPRK